MASEGSRYASFSASETGVLISATDTVRSTTRLAWWNRAGRQLGTVGTPARYQSLALSSDESRVAVVLTTGRPDNTDLWVLEAAGGRQVRLTFDAGIDNSPVWSRDDLRVAFEGNREGAPTLRQKRVDGTTNEEALLALGVAIAPTDWSADGRYIAYVRTLGTAGSTDIWALPLFGDRKPIPLVQTRYDETNAVFSPDGRWFAYQSNETGQAEIYVQPFPSTGGTFQVSKNGGTQPSWRRDGKELYFLSRDSQLMAAAVDTTHEFQAGTPAALFAVATLPNSGPAFGRQYAATKDGQRFLVNVVQEPSLAIPLTVVVNWLSAVQR